MPYGLGLLEGFQARRDSEFQRNYEADQQQRQQESQLYQYLMQSQDPEMRALALHGLFTSAGPGQKKGGFRGFMGEMQSSSTYPQIRSLADSLVPDPSSAPAPPPVPGSAALPDRSPVEARAQVSSADAMQGAASPPQFTDPGQAFGQAQEAPAPPPLFDQGPMQGSPQQPQAPPPPPESPFKRRGTGVPTAEEIAEMQARVPLQARIGVARQQLAAAGATPEEIQHAIMGMLGAPNNQRLLSQVNQWGVRLPGSPDVVPVLLDQTQGYTTAGGKALPQGAQMVRMSGGAGAGAGLTTTIRDSPETRAQYGIPPDEVTPSGYWRVKQQPDGTHVFLAAEYAPPPALSGTTTVYDDQSETGRSVVGVTRGGARGARIGPAEPSGAPTQDQINAQALLEEVTKVITGQEKARLPGIPGKPVLPAQRDQIVQQRAAAAGLPYQTYFELEQAAKSRPANPNTRTGQPGGAKGLSTADLVRQRALENRKATAPPAGPPARQGGPGPVR